MREGERDTHSVVPKFCKLDNSGGGGGAVVFFKTANARSQ